MGEARRRRDAGHPRRSGSTGAGFVVGRPGRPRTARPHGTARRRRSNRPGAGVSPRCAATWTTPCGSRGSGIQYGPRAPANTAPHRGDPERARLDRYTAAVNAGGPVAGRSGRSRDRVAGSARLGPLRPTPSAWTSTCFATLARRRAITGPACPAPAAVEAPGAPSRRPHPAHPGRPPRRRSPRFGTTTRPPHPRPPLPLVDSRKIDFTLSL